MGRRRSRTPSKPQAQDRAPHLRSEEVREARHDEQPRARLLRCGAESLTDAELLSVLLSRGCAGTSDLEREHVLLAEVRGLGGLSKVDRHTLRQIDLEEASAAALLAAVELAVRLANPAAEGRELLDQPAALARYLRLRYAQPDHEVMGAVFLDARSRRIDDCEVFRGTHHRVAVEPRGVLKLALLRSAASFVLFHTHPSGDPSPSPEDREFTRRMTDAGKLMGIRMVDHLILGAEGRWISMRRLGLLETREGDS